MSKIDVARRSDSLYFDNISRRALCDRIASLERLAEAMPYCWNGWCEDGCPFYEGKSCMAVSMARILGVDVDVESA